MNVEAAEFDEIKALAGEAARAGVSIDNRTSTSWYRIMVDGDLAGAAGLLELRAGIFRLKGVYVKPAYRGRGYGRALTLHRLEQARERLGSMVEAISYRPEFFEALGFKRAGRPRANGAVRVWRVI